MRAGEAMATQRDKTVSYRRAVWFNDNPASINLAMCVRDAAAKLTTVADRTIPRAGGQYVSLASIKTDGDGGHHLHLTVDTPGEAASIVPTDKTTSSELKVSTTAPPTDSEFMDGDAFVYVKLNDVCLCTTGTTDATVRYFLFKFFEKAKIRSDSTKFDLMKVANENKIAMLHRQGVREIEFWGTVYKATADYIKRKGQPVGLLSNLSREMKAVLGLQNDANHDALNVTLSFKIDRRRKGIALGEQRLENLAVAALSNLEEEDDFVIETGSGQKISPTEIFIKSTVAIDSLGKSVERDKAWKELKVFYNNLALSGALEA